MSITATNLIVYCAILVDFAIEYRLGYLAGRDDGYEKAKREQHQKKAQQQKAEGQEK